GLECTGAWNPYRATVRTRVSTTPSVVATLAMCTYGSIPYPHSFPTRRSSALSPLSFTITPAVAPGATQAVTISTTVFTPGGTYTIGISCTCSVGTHTSSFSSTVTAAAFNYSVAWNPTSNTIASGASTSPSVVA